MTPEVHKKKGNLFNIICLAILNREEPKKKTH